MCAGIVRGAATAGARAVIDHREAHAPRHEDIISLGRGENPPQRYARASDKFQGRERPGKC